MKAKKILLKSIIVDFKFIETFTLSESLSSLIMKFDFYIL